MRLIAAMVVACGGAAMANDDVVRVFILAGQSNMQGQGSIRSLEGAIEDEPDRFGHLREDGTWVVRDDVFIDDMRGHGALTVGYGANEEKVGPELGFGWVVGDASEAPVLLIKASWGGKSVRTDFLPPSEGGPGESYEQMLGHVRDALDHYEERFPALAGREASLEGFVFFQGWNDMVDGEQRDEEYASYTRRLRSMIEDVRTALGEEDLPVVVGVMGVGGEGEQPEFRAAQRAVGENLEKVRIVETWPHYDMDAHAMFENDVWKGEDKDRFYRIASDRPYHYLGSARTYYLIGAAFGDAILDMTP